MFISNEVKNILDKLNYPNEWILGSHTIKFKNGLTIWIANGLLFLSIQPVDISFNIFEKIVLWKAIKLMSIRKGLINDS